MGSRAQAARGDGQGIVVRPDPAVQVAAHQVLVPVIFLTAKGGGEALAEGFESGAIMYINKPFTANKLLTIVNTMLESGTNL